MARLLQLSDLHAVAPGARVSGILDTPRLLREGIDHLLNRREAFDPIDAVLVTGDVSDDGSDESYAVARAELERLGLPLMVVPGNHDRREGLRSAFSDLPEMPARGPINWVADVAGSLIVGLDTLVEGQGGGLLCEEGLALLTDAIAGAQGRDILVALHHPPIEIGIRFMDAIGLANSSDLEARLSRHDGPLRVVAGHVHGVHHGQIGRHPVSTAPSVCSAFALDFRVDAPVGFMTGPRGCAVIETGPQGVWTAIPFDGAEGPHAF